MSHKIESGIPLPGETVRPGRKPIHPFAELEVGDSVMVYTEKMRSYAISYAHHAKKKFTTRKQDCGGIRVWRFS